MRRSGDLIPVVQMESPILRKKVHINVHTLLNP